MSKKKYSPLFFAMEKAGCLSVRKYTEKYTTYGAVLVCQDSALCASMHFCLVASPPRRWRTLRL